MRTEGDESVVISWTPPDRSTWGCPVVSYLIRGTQNGRPIQARVNADQRSFALEHRFASEPNAEWKLRVQTVNAGGESPFSPDVSTQTVQQGWPVYFVSHGN